MPPATQNTQGTKGKPKQGKNKGNGGLKKPGPNKRKQPAKLRHDVSDDPMHLNFQGHRSPKRGQLAVDWSVLEQQYIAGWLEEDPETKSYRRVYPSLREIAERHRVKLPTVQYHSKHRNWLERRRKFVLQMKQELDEELAKARGLDTAAVVGMLDTFVRRFGVAIEEDHISRATIKDLEMALRLRHWVKKENDALNQPKTTLSLDTLQARHRELRERGQKLTTELAGQIPGRTEREEQALAEQEEKAKEQAAAAKKAAEEHAARQVKAPRKVREQPREKPPKPVSAARRAVQEARRRAGLAAVAGHAAPGKRSQDQGRERRASDEAWARAERAADPWEQTERIAIAAC